MQKCVKELAEFLDVSCLHFKKKKKKLVLNCANFYVILNRNVMFTTFPAHDTPRNVTFSAVISFKTKECTSKIYIPYHKPPMKLFFCFFYTDYGLPSFREHGKFNGISHSACPSRAVSRNNHSTIKVYQAPEARDHVMSALQPSVDMYR